MTLLNVMDMKRDGLTRINRWIRILSLIISSSILRSMDILTGPDGEIY